MNDKKYANIVLSMKFSEIPTSVNVGNVLK